MPGALNKLTVMAHSGAEFLDIEKIVRCEGVGNYTMFYLTDQRKIISSKGLGEYEKELVRHHFFRIHKTHLVNLKMVSEYLRGRGGAVKLLDGMELSVSRYRKQALLKELALLFSSGK